MLLHFIGEEMNQKPLSLLILMTLVAGIAPCHAITWCHDYTLWRVTGKDANATSPQALRNALSQRKYSLIDTVTADTPGLDSRVKPGDVVIVGDAHSGFVSTFGIDHYIQKAGSSGAVLPPENAISQPNFNSGWTLSQLINLKEESLEYDPNDPSKVIA